ncbi:MAG: MFS transporter [Candidatus Lokiarchaeota archaeon]|nr:MFS transporter [Candidatus Lokiarchaeota archaeon]MBD3199734.1 MFS transporter [Candidatus Lokiarchaeota archaeon]
MFYNIPYNTFKYRYLFKLIKRNGLIMITKENIEYKRLYTLIFSMNYLFQGFTTSMFTVIVPIYILDLVSVTGDTITTSDISFIASIILIPSAIKLIYGILSDKFGIKNIGRRRPWIIIPVFISGLFWILLPFLVRFGDLIVIFTGLGFIINLGVMMADTALDGLILDICPKERLGRVQGVVWGYRSIGMIGGGPFLAILVVTGIFERIDYTFIFLGILMIISSLITFFIKEPTEYLKINMRKNFKKLFKDKKDVKTYLFSLFNAVSDGVILLYLSLYILIQLGILESQQASLNISPDDNLTAFLYQSYISLTVSAGIIIGALVGGIIADLKSRKLNVYIAMIFTSISIFFVLVNKDIVYFFIISGIIGIGIGWRHSAYSPVVSQMAKFHPKMDSTYFSLCNSLSNLGSTLGLTFMGLIFAETASYLIVFIIIAIFQLINLVPFSTISSSYYETPKLKIEEI